MAPRLALVTVLLLVEIVGPVRLQRAGAALRDFVRSAQDAAVKPADR